MKLKLLQFALICSCLIARNSPATVFRLLTGDYTTINPDNWSATENGYSYDEVVNGSPYAPWISTNHFVDNYSIGIEVPTDTSGNKERFEYRIISNTDTNAPHFNNFRYCGFAFMLATNALPFTDSTLIWQGFQGSPWGAPAMLKFGKSTSPPYLLRMSIRNMIDGPDSSTSEFQLWTNSMIYPGVWYSVVIYIQPCYNTNTALVGYNTNGNIKLWIDGTNYVNWSGEIGYDPTLLYNTTNGDITTDTNGSAGVDNGLDVKDGIYQPDANNGHTVYFDEIAVADNYNDACPVRPPQLAMLASDGGPVNITVKGNTVASYTGKMSADYVFQASPDLINWTNLITTNPTALPFQFIDTSPNTQSRFYRVEVSP